MKRSAPFACVAALALMCACSKRHDDPEARATPGNRGSSSGIVKVDGSSTVYLISEAVAEEYRAQGDATIAASGTGGGFKKLCRGEIDVAGASRPIKQEEAEACKAAGIDFVELPVAYDGLAIVVNPENHWVDELTVAELARMWAPEAAGRITSWSQIRDGWPDTTLVLFGPGTDSGTYDYFTQAVVGKEHSSRGDYTSSEDDNVLVQGVEGDAGALGFFGYAYYAENKAKLKLVPVDGGQGPVAPDPETVADGSYQPLSRPLFIYVSTKALEKPAVETFVRFYLDQARALAPDVGYIALPDAAYELTRKRLADRKTGSMFAGGSQVGMTIEKLLAAEGS